MKFTLTISDTHYQELRKLLILEDGLERPALLLCGRSTIQDDLWNGGTEERFLSYKVIPIPEEEILENSKNHVTWDTTTFRRAMKICKEESLAMCLVHNHPNNVTKYSETDDINEPALIKGVFNRNGGKKPHASIVITPNGQVFGRIYNQQLKSEPITLIRIIGEKFQFHYPNKESLDVSEIFHRQQLAFGKSLTQDLSKLTAGIIGCGATGSSTAHLLSRLGVGKMLLVDDDIVERSNLSRLYGATAADADAGKSKVDVLKDFITGAAIGTKVKALKEWLGSEKSRSALKSCDLIFCCTDDNSGRIFLNRFAHFYLTPVFDMGIVIVPDEDKPGKLRNVFGRVTVIQTEKHCLICRGIVDPFKAAEEDLKRSDPEGFEQRKNEGYIQGIDNPSPAVITFTSEISSVAVNEFLNRITGFKKNGSQFTIMRFFDEGIDRKPGAKSREGCPICHSQEYWGRGDINPFLDQTSW